MQKIKLKNLNADDMRVIAGLLEEQLKYPVNTHLEGGNKFFAPGNSFLMLDFITNRLLINLFEKRFNKAVFEDRVYSVSLSEVEAVALFKILLKTGKGSGLGVYQKSIYVRLKMYLHREIMGLPTHECFTDLG